MIRDQNYEREEIPIILIGNKIDCEPSEREVERDLADSLTKNHGIEHYFEISCKTGETIEIKTNNRSKRCTGWITWLCSYHSTVKEVYPKTSPLKCDKKCLA